jgi:hypothetical protein
MKFLNLFLFLTIYSFTSFGQEKSTELKRQINEIENYIKLIDSNPQKNREEHDSKKIKNIEREERSWEAYCLKENKEGNKPLRIKYKEFGPKKTIRLNLYYQKGEIVFAEYMEKQKKKNGTILKTLFYFQKSILVYKTEEENLKFSLSELFDNEKMIKAYF